MQGLRWFLWSLVGVALVLGALLLLHTPKPEIPALSAALGGVGGPFAMQDQQGKPFTEQDLHGSPALMFFGFTNCPDVCPTTLADIAGWLKQIGPPAQKLKIVFVSVDPARDTPEVMKNYLSMFEAPIIGLTGTPQQLAAMAKNYKIYYRQVPQAHGGYTMDHSAAIYLLNGQQQLVGTIAYREDEATAIGKIKRLLESN